MQVGLAAFALSTDCQVPAPLAASQQVASLCIHAWVVGSHPANVPRPKQGSSCESLVDRLCSAGGRPPSETAQVLQQEQAGLFSPSLRSLALSRHLAHIHVYHRARFLHRTCYRNFGPQSFDLKSFSVRLRLGGLEAGPCETSR